MRKYLKVLVFFMLACAFFLGVLAWRKEYAKSEIRESMKKTVLESIDAGTYEVPAGDYLSVSGEDMEPDLDLLASWIKIAQYHEGTGSEEYAALHLAGVIEIPSLAIEEPVWKENTDVAMRYGVIVMEDFAGIEEDGNCVILGHRSLVTSTTFWNLTDISEDDEVLITTPDGVRHEYRVSGTYYCSPYDLQSYLDGPDNCAKQITLVTCAKERGTSWRFIAVLLPCESKVSSIQYTD